jgi:hypothetical protein
MCLDVRPPSKGIEGKFTSLLATGGSVLLYSRVLAHKVVQ